MLSPIRSRWFAAALSLSLLCGGFAGSAAQAQDAAPAPLPSATPVVPLASEKVDMAMMAKIRDEGMNRSQVMATAKYLTDVIGPRLTASPGAKRANDWTRGQLMGWGLQNAHLEEWGPFGRGWTLTNFSAAVTAPTPFPLIAIPKAWSPSLKRPIDAEVVYLDAKDAAGLDAFKGKLKGKIVFVGQMSEIAAHFTPQGERYTDAQLAEIAAPPAAAPGGGRPGGRQGAPANSAAIQFIPLRNRFIQQEGAALLVDTSRGDGGTLIAQQATNTLVDPQAPRDQRVSVWSPKAPKDIVPQVVVSAEQFNRILRMVQAGESVKMHVELEAQFNEENKGLPYNTIAEIPGSDKKDEIVMCGAHMDSWHSSTGATDNAAGDVVCMEAVRILQAVGVKPRRTIRIALWTGEEEGLLGSEAYVAQHFGTFQSPKPEYANLAAYFNLDNGTGKVRGVYGQGNAAVLPIFAAWLQPFTDLGASTLTLRNTGSTDHISFAAIGLPGFQFIQDGIEYFGRTHHTNQDSYDRLQEGDLKQASVIMAAFLYNAAMRDDKLPRVPPPAPRRPLN